jgi:uncharacterized integral membrane protein
MVPDDDFDIDVDALAGDEEEAAPAPPTAPALATACPAPAATPAAAAQASAGGASRAMSARKPGPWQQLGDKVTAPFTRVRLPEWNLKTFIYLLGILIILWFLLENWPPCRVRLLVWNGEAPKNVLFIANLVLGALLLRWWQIFTASRQARRDAAAQPSPEK